MVAVIIARRWPSHRDMASYRNGSTKGCFEAPVWLFHVFYLLETDAKVYGTCLYRLCFKSLKRGLDMNAYQTGVHVWMREQRSIRQNARSGMIPIKSPHFR